MIKELDSKIELFLILLTPKVQGAYKIVNPNNLIIIKNAKTIFYYGPFIFLMAPKELNSNLETSKLKKY